MTSSYTLHGSQLKCCCIIWIMYKGRWYWFLRFQNNLLGVLHHRIHNFCSQFTLTFTSKELVAFCSKAEYPSQFDLKGDNHVPTTAARWMGFTESLQLSIPYALSNAHYALWEDMSDYFFPSPNNSVHNCFKLQFMAHEPSICKAEKLFHCLCQRVHDFFIQESYRL